MRTIRYYVVNKETGKAVFTDCRKAECEKFLQTLENSEHYTIAHKWMSL